MSLQEFGEVVKACRLLLLLGAAACAGGLSAQSADGSPVMSVRTGPFNAPTTWEDGRTPHPDADYIATNTVTFASGTFSGNSLRLAGNRYSSNSQLAQLIAVPDVGAIDPVVFENEGLICQPETPAGSGVIGLVPTGPLVEDTHFYAGMEGPLTVRGTNELSRAVVQVMSPSVPSNCTYHLSLQSPITVSRPSQLVFVATGMNSRMDVVSRGDLSGAAGNLVLSRNVTWRQASTALPVGSQVNMLPESGFGALSTVDCVVVDGLNLQPRSRLVVPQDGRGGCGMLDVRRKLNSGPSTFVEFEPALSNNVAAPERLPVLLCPPTAAWTNLVLAVDSNAGGVRYVLEAELREDGRIQVSAVAKKQPSPGFSDAVRDAVATYDGTGHGPVLDFADAPSGLAVSYSDSAGGPWRAAWGVTNAGSYDVYVRVESDPYETEVVKRTVTVLRKPLTAGMVGAVTNSYHYTGEAFTPRPEISDAAPCVMSENDYALAYYWNVNAGYARIDVKGLGNYTGQVTRTFQILPRVNSWTVEPVQDGWTYGDEPKPLRAEAAHGTVEWRYYGREADGTPVHAAEAVTNAGNYTVMVRVNGGVNDESLSRELPFSIAPRTVSLTSASAEKVFDGTPLTARSVLVGGDGLVGLERFDWVISGSQTEVGLSSNAFTFAAHAGTKIENYAVSCSYGTLTVTPAAFGSGDGGDEEPLPGSVPANGVSKCDAEYVYDGEGHTIDTNKLASLIFSGGAFSLSYSLSAEGPFSESPPFFTGAGATSVWYRVSAPNYADYVHEARVTIAKRPLSIVGASGQWTYDGMAHAETNVVVSGALEGDEIVCSDFVALTEVGWTTNTFTWGFAEGTDAANYDVTATFGFLIVSGLPEPPDDMVTNVVDVVVTNTVRLVLTNVVNVTHVTTNVVTVVQTNFVDVAVGAGPSSAVVVPPEIRMFRPAAGFTGAEKKVLTGVVCDAEGGFLGLAQVTTGKAGAKGVKVGGFLMLSDGKKQALKSVTVPVEDGCLVVSTAVGKTGTVELVVGADGFAGTFGDRILASADLDEQTGVLSGSLSLTCFNAGGKVKKQKVVVRGTAFDGGASGGVTVKGGAERGFNAVTE